MERPRNAPIDAVRGSPAAGQPVRLCSKLCSDRVNKRQIGTLHDRIAIGWFWARNRESWRNSRWAARALVGLANRRLQPLGHLTAQAKCN